MLGFNFYCWEKGTIPQNYKSYSVLTLGTNPTPESSHRSRVKGRYWGSHQKPVSVGPSRHEAVPSGLQGQVQEENGMSDSEGQTGHCLLPYPSAVTQRVGSTDPVISRIINNPNMHCQYLSQTDQVPPGPHVRKWSPHTQTTKENI